MVTEGRSPGRAATPDDTTVNPDTELSRIKTVYSKRKDLTRYSSFQPATLFARQECERKFLAFLAAAGISALSGLRILELGCGTGFWLREFIKWGAQPENIFGIDLLPERIAEAKRLSPLGVHLECGNAAELTGSVTFDVILQSTMFSSILDAQMRRQIAREMLRVLRPNGCILWYDLRLNNPQNPDVKGIRKSELRDLFPNCRIKFQTLTLAPPIARAVAPKSTAAYRLLSSIRPLRTHYLALIRHG